MKITRRQVILSSAAVGLSAMGLKYYLPQNNLYAPSFTEQGLIYGFGKTMFQNKELFFLSFLNLNTFAKKLDYLPLNFFGHGIAFHPYKSNIITAFEKQGPNAAEMDLNTGLVKMIPTDPKRFFYGHGVYVKDPWGASSKPEALKLFSTETVLSTGEGLIVVRDAETLEIEGEFPTYGTQPHDCILTDNDTVLIVTNDGSIAKDKQKPSVTYVDIKTQKLLDKYEVDNSRFSSGDLAISKDENLVTVAIASPASDLEKSEKGLISLVARENNTMKKLVSLTEPQDVLELLIGESLGVCLDDDRGVFAATSPEGHIVTFWSLKSGEFLSAIRINNPRGVALTKDNKYFLINFGKNSSLAFINADTLLLEKELTMSRAGFSGSHLYRI